MKRVIPWLLGVLSLVLLTACGQTVSDPKVDNWQKYQKEQSITIGFDNTFVPMGFEQKDGSYAGFDIDLANQVFDSYGIHVNWQPIDWDMKETELKNGTIDAIWNGYSATDERRESVAFTKPYMKNEQVLVTKKASGIQSVDGMKEKRLGAQSFNEALIDLQNDRIDGLLIDRVYANYYLQTEGILKDYNVFPVGFETESFAVGVRKADKTLKKKIDEAFVKLYQKGQFQKISKKWFGTDVATDDIK